MRDSLDSISHPIASARCPRCGTSLASGAPFCSNCGIRAKPTASSAAFSANWQFCSNCHSAEPPEARFCRTCGRHLDQPPAPTHHAAPPVRPFVYPFRRVVGIVIFIAIAGGMIAKYTASNSMPAYSGPAGGTGSFQSPLTIQTDTDARGQFGMRLRVMVTCTGVTGATVAFHFQHTNDQPIYTIDPNYRSQNGELSISVPIGFAASSTSVEAFLPYTAVPVLPPEQPIQCIPFLYSSSGAELAHGSPITFVIRHGRPPMH